MKYLYLIQIIFTIINLTACAHAEDVLNYGLESNRLLKMAPEQAVKLYIANGGDHRTGYRYYLECLEKHNNQYLKHHNLFNNETKPIREAMTRWREDYTYLHETISGAGTIWVDLYLKCKIYEEQTIMGLANVKYKQNKHHKVRNQRLQLILIEIERELSTLAEMKYPIHKPVGFNSNNFNQVVLNSTKSTMGLADKSRSLTLPAQNLVAKYIIFVRHKMVE